MKKLFLSLVLGLTVLFSTSSCVSGAYAQDSVITESSGDVDISLVIRYGTPYYFEGSVLYYLYDGWYYYPYLHNKYYYYYRYARPLPPPRPGHRFVPRYNDRPHFKHHRDYRPMRSPTYSTQRPSGHKSNINNRTTTPNRRNGSINRPTPQMRGNSGGGRPVPQMRSGGSTHGNGHFGERR